MFQFACSRRILSTSIFYNNALDIKNTTLLAGARVFLISAFSSVHKILEVLVSEDLRKWNIYIIFPDGYLLLTHTKLRKNLIN